MAAMAIDALAICLELIIYFFFFRHFFGKAKFSPKTMFAIYAGLGVVSFCLSWLAVPDMVQTTGYFAVILLLAACYKGQLFVKLFVPFLFQTIGFMVENCYALLLEPLRLEGLAYGEAGRNVYYFTGVVLSNLTILFLVRFLANTKDYLFIKKHDIEIPLYFSVLFMFPAAMLFVINQLEMLVLKMGQISLFAMLPALILTGFTVAFFFFFDGLLQSIQNKQQLELLRSQLEQEQQYHTILLNKHQKFQQLRHDMKYSFGNIAGLIKNGHNDEALQYAQQQSGQLASTSVIETGHPLLDTMLTIREDQAKTLGAEFQSYVTADLSKVEISMDDLASLCSNALSNAVEAVAHIADPAQRKIWCNITQDKQYLHIAVRNTTANDVPITDNTVETTKTDKILHGFGLKIIRQITEKYNGTYTLQCKNRMFTVQITLPTNREEWL